MRTERAAHAKEQWSPECMGRHELGEEEKKVLKERWAGPRSDKDILGTEWIIS